MTHSYLVVGCSDAASPMKRAIWYLFASQPESIAVLWSVLIFCPSNFKRVTNGLTENDRPSKLQDVKLVDQVAWHELAGHKNARHDTASFLPLCV